MLDLPVYEPGAAFDGLPPGGAHSAAFTGGRVITCAGGVVEAIDPASGRVQWRRLAAQLRAHPSGDPRSLSWCRLTVVAPGEVAVGDLVNFPGQGDDGIWILNVANGTVGRRITLPDPHTGDSMDPDIEALSASLHVVSVIEDSTVYGLDRSSGALRWRVRLRPWAGAAVIGHVLYADNRNDDSEKSAATAIQRLDLASGHRLPDLPLGRRLRGANSGVLGQQQAVVAAAQPMSALLFQSGARDSPKVSAIDPSTGLIRWTHPGDTERLDQAAEPSRVVLLRFPGGDPDAAEEGGKTIPWTLRTVDMRTGKPVSTVKTARSVPYDSLDMDTDAGYPWNYDDSLLIAYDGAKPGGKGNGYTRLEGVDPATGQVRWRGPWSVDTWVLGDAPWQHLIIAESCAPSGISASVSPDGHDATCTKARLYAINA